MFSGGFFQTKLGKASIVSVLAMTLFVALSTQMHVGPARSGLSGSAAGTGIDLHMMVELA